MSSAERRADAQARADAERAPARRIRAAFFVGGIAILIAILGASLDPHNRLTGFLFGGLTGMIIGVALLALPRESDYPPDDIDRTLGD